MEIELPQEVTTLDGERIPASRLVGRLLQLHYRSGLKCGALRKVNAETLPTILRLIQQRDLVVSLL